MTFNIMEPFRHVRKGGIYPRKRPSELKIQKIQSEYKEKRGKIKKI